MSLTSNPRSFGTICNGEIEILLLTNENLEEALSILEKSFFVNESICRGCELSHPENDQALKEMLELCRTLATDGVSLIAKDRQNNKIAGVSLNTIQFLDESSEESFFEKFKRTHCQSPLGKFILDYILDWDKEFDIFENYKINCLFEIMFLSTLPEYGGRKIGLTLCQYSVDMATELSKGIGCENLAENLRDKRPKIVSALFTSKISQKLGKALGMEFLKEAPYSNCSYNGKLLSERIGPEHPSCWLCALKL